MGVDDVKPIDGGARLGADPGVQDLDVEVTQDIEDVVEQSDPVDGLDFENGAGIALLVGQEDPLRNAEFRLGLIQYRGSRLFRDERFEIHRGWRLPLPLQASMMRDSILRVSRSRPIARKLVVQTRKISSTRSSERMNRSALRY